MIETLRHDLNTNEIFLYQVTFELLTSVCCFLKWSFFLMRLCVGAGNGCCSKGSYFKLDMLSWHSLRWDFFRKTQAALRTSTARWKGPWSVYLVIFRNTGNLKATFFCPPPHPSPFRCCLRGGGWGGHSKSTASVQSHPLLPQFTTPQTFCFFLFFSPSSMGGEDTESD